ncbi:phenylacetate-CoA oxygenase/reductase subunit PaaK [Xylanimonas allomyrinae]|uniref:Phenylacetate-CoA oxygenase/reductase subunit PaaK n=1 Tax=Xylanimonas allomyrinae TaxID=2509459 RepID=A0A4P6EPC0_9MICO|nr:1,2-phenylacetyl-CoA epoxidase subunit PaaE [Xylanimonas allomyrinae]QAY64614.1 phenylacetate-CoA oxygenase/reductase subunit PaaK [Xylanimonas allomyrinae]
MTTTATPTRRRARFHTLRVTRVRPLTTDSVEVTFAVPGALADDYDYAPGQYVALRATIDGQEVRRSYSLCRPPQAGEIAVAIKRDHGGLFSTWANDVLAAGAEIDVMSPQGTFTSDLRDLDGKHLAGIAAGSGITPLMALVRSTLDGSPTARVSLVYANRSTPDVMFLEELADLKDRYPDRFALHHVLTREKRTAPLLSGHLDADRLDAVLNGLVRPQTVDEWFLCGPLGLVQTCRDSLDRADVDRTHVRYELFTTGEPGDGPRRAAPVTTGDGPSVQIDFTLDGQSARVTTPVDARETILDAALRVRPDTPFACAGGVCGTCRARVIEGSVQMAENYALEPEEIERGYVLTCQSHPTTPCVVLDYDV